MRRLVHVPLTQDQSDALVSFDYNMGAKRLGEIAILLNMGDYKRVASLLEHFNNGDPGLRKRRHAEAAMFRAPR
jgi:lysozyme